MWKRIFCFLIVLALARNVLTDEDIAPTCCHNEIYRNGTCDPTCDELTPSCLKGDTLDCYCLLGYVRNAEGKCVLPAECPLKCTPVCPPPEVLNACPAYCSHENTCDILFSGFIPDCPPPPEDYKCEPRCECPLGLVRNGTSCMAPDLCCEGANEKAVDCPALCDLTTEGVRQQDCDCYTKACRCQPGFARDADGVCVEYGPKCNATEVLNTCVPYCSFEPDCPSLFEGIIRDCAAPPIDYQCGMRCECLPGLVRSGTDCLSPDTCCQGVNETAVDCPAPCDWKTDGFRDTNCTCIASKGCRCKPMHARNEDGDCVPMDFTCGTNEVFREGTCDGTCLFPSHQCKVLNHYACFCLPGYVRNDEGVCTLLAECGECQQNEMWIEGTCDLTCKSPINHSNCTTKNHYDCFCLPGFVRDNKGKCIPVAQCQNCKKCKKNEIWMEGTCDATCEEPNRQCRIKNHFDCFCLPGYVRNDEGECIPLIECKNCKKCDLNEIWIEGTCDGTCQEPNRKCRVRNHFDCFCLPGFVRNEAGKCVPLCECKNCPVCGTNEICKEGTCDGTCEEPNRQCRIKNHFDCFCLEGFLRDAYGNCIDDDLCNATLVDPVGPVDPLCPVGPVVPVLPVDPADPLCPVDPVDPFDPVDPIKPVDPGHPRHPKHWVYAGHDWEDFDDIPDYSLKRAIRWLKERIHHMKAYCFCY